MIRRNEVDGQITFEASDRQEVVDALKEVFLTEIGQHYKNDCYTVENGDEDLEKILRAAQIVAGGPNLTVDAMRRGLELLVNSGEIRPRDFESSPELTEPEEDTRPRDKNGKLLTPQQIQWSEYRQFAETASMAEVRRRKETDSGFANFVRKNLQREMAQEIGDAVVPEGQANGQRTSRQISGDLVNFVHAFRAEPSENLRPKGGYVLLGGRKIPHSELIEKIGAATNAGLL